MAEALGPDWDLDPCSNARSRIISRFTFRLDRQQDGLRNAPRVHRDWTVFINPPYSNGNVLRWFEAYKHTRFCFLVRLDPSTEWFRRLYRASELRCMPRRRVNFEPPPGVQASSNVFPHLLFFRRASDATEAIRRLCFSWRTSP